MSIKIDKARFDIKWRAPGELAPNPHNHRLHPDRQKELMRAALADEGWIDPVIFNRQTGRLVDGHERVEEAMAAGVEAVPVIEIDVDEATERRIIARHDRIGALAEIDFEALAANLAAEGIDSLPELLGWEPDEFTQGPEVAPAGAELGENGFGYQEQFGVIVVCEDAAGQEAAYNELCALGYTVKVVTV